MNIKDFRQVTPWSRALDAARITVGKEPTGKEPSDEWKARMLKAEHSPIRLVEYEWTWEGIPYWVTNHIVRHHVGCEKFVVSQRDDRNANEVSRADKPQGQLIDMHMCCNAQALINISRKRLCHKASLETRTAWWLVKCAVNDVDYVMANAMVSECVYRGFCPEPKSCGFVNTGEYEYLRDKYVKNKYLDKYRDEG